MWNPNRNTPISQIHCSVCAPKNASQRTQTVFNVIRITRFAVASIYLRQATTHSERTNSRCRVGAYLLLKEKPKTNPTHNSYWTMWTRGWTHFSPERARRIFRTNNILKYGNMTVKNDYIALYAWHAYTGNVNAFAATTFLFILHLEMVMCECLWIENCVSVCSE